jgi:hypothetical protein
VSFETGAPGLFQRQAKWGVEVEVRFQAVDGGALSVSRSGHYTHWIRGHCLKML